MIRLCEKHEASSVGDWTDVPSYVGDCPVCALKLSDERNRLRATLRWAYDRLDIDGGMTESEQRRTVEEIGKTLAGEPSRASDYRPDSDEASMRRERGQWPT